MSERIIACPHPGCGARAIYKVAAPWAGSGFNELKTYGFACPAHLGDVFRAAEERRARYRPAPDETLGPIAIYRCEPGRPGWQLQRRADLEEHNRSWGTGQEGV
jgi:hypothetical protein